MVMGVGCRLYAVCGGMGCCLTGVGCMPIDPCPGVTGGAVSCCGFGLISGVAGSSCLAVISGEFNDMNSRPRLLGEVGDSAVNSSGRFLNQVALGLPADGTLVNLGVPGLDNVPKFLYAVEIDSSWVEVLGCSLVFPLSVDVTGAVGSPVSGFVTVDGPGVLVGPSRCGQRVK